MLIAQPGCAQIDINGQKILVVTCDSSAVIKGTHTMYHKTKVNCLGSRFDGILYNISYLSGGVGMVFPILCSQGIPIYSYIYTECLWLSECVFAWKNQLLSVRAAAVVTPFITKL